MEKYYMKSFATGRGVANGRRPHESAPTWEEFLRKVYANEHLRLDATGTMVQHVKDGKPLTEKGAKLLGVSWP
jgi:hypothetical protein